MSASGDFALILAADRRVTALLLGLIVGWSIAAAPTLIPLVFGDRWTPAVPVFQLTAATSVAGVPAQFVRGLAYAAGESRQMVAWTLVAVVVIFVGFAPLLPAFGLAGGGLAFVLYAVVLLVGFERATRHLARFPWLRVLRIYFLVSHGWQTLVGGTPLEASQ